MMGVAGLVLSHTVGTYDNGQILQPREVVFDGTGVALSAVSSTSRDVPSARKYTGCGCHEKNVAFSLASLQMCTKKLNIQDVVVI